VTPQPGKFDWSKIAAEGPAAVAVDEIREFGETGSPNDLRVLGANGSRHPVALAAVSVEVAMKSEARKSQPASSSSLPATEAPTPRGASNEESRPALKLAGTPELSAEEYERVLQKVASELFLNDEQFRKAVVLREVRKVVLGWGTAIGIGSVIAVTTLYVNARDALKQSTSTELSKAVKEHVSARTELLNDSIKSLTNTAVGQIVHVQKELETAQTALALAEQQLATANQQSGDLQKRITAVSETLRLVQQNSAWLGDSQNAQRVAGFIRTLSQEQNAKAIGDLLVRLDRLEALQIDSQIVQRASILDDTHRKALEISRLLNTLPKEQIDKLESSGKGGATSAGPGGHAFDKWDAYLRGSDSQTK
jgi:hypothetical protein